MHLKSVIREILLPASLILLAIFWMLDFPVLLIGYLMG